MDSVPYNLMTEKNKLLFCEIMKKKCEKKEKKKS
jgi:hypothetical protein